MMKLIIVAASFHKEIAEEMIAAAEAAAKTAGWDIAKVMKVPGAYEIPLITQHVLESEKPDAIVALGFIERGETLHGEVMGHVVHKELIDLQLKHSTSIGIGIIGPGATEDQVHVRKIQAATGAVEAAIKVYSLLH